MTRVKKIMNDLIVIPSFVVTRPFKGFSRVKDDKEGSWVAALILIIIFSSFSIVNYNTLGFIVNFNNPSSFNSLVLFFGSFGPILLFVISNWSVATITNGKGTFKEILMVAGYACFPIIISSIAANIYSNIMISEEIYLYFLIINIGSLLSLFVVLTGLITIHEYSLGDVVKNLLLSIVSLMVIMFILLLLFSLTLQFYDFIITFFREVTIRLGG
ncbi:MAG: Yip1 family protein [Mycoplasmatales bacterium]